MGLETKSPTTEVEPTGTAEGRAGHGHNASLPAYVGLQHRADTGPVSSLRALQDLSACHLQNVFFPSNRENKTRRGKSSCYRKLHYLLLCCATLVTENNITSGRITLFFSFLVSLPLVLESRYKWTQYLFLMLILGHYLIISNLIIIKNTVKMSNKQQSYKTKKNTKLLHGLAFGLSPSVNGFHVLHSNA